MRENLDITQRTEEQRELRLMVLSLFERMQKLKKMQAELDDDRKNVNRYLTSFLSKQGYDKAVIKTDKKQVSMVVVQPKKIEWDIAKLKQNLKGESKILKQIINKEVMITDLDSLIDLLKQHGVDPDDFKRCISVSESVNEEQLNQLHEIGEISTRWLKGTYKVKHGTSYIRMAEVKSKVEE